MALVRKMTIDNSAILYKTAKLLNCEWLLEATRSYIEENFEKVVKAKSFEELDKESLLELLRHKVG